MPYYQESGSGESLISLGGIRSLRGWGRRFDVASYQAGGTVPYVNILQDNPKRIAAIIQNIGPDSIAVQAPGNDWLFIITSGGSFQIDENFPFTGALLAYAVGPTYASSVTVIETSL